MVEETLVSVTTTNQQPIIIIVGDNDTLKIEQLFIKIKHQKLHVPGKNIVFCFDYFFKIFWIFNINYCNQLENLMYFFELILKLKTSRSKHL